MAYIFIAIKCSSIVSEMPHKSKFSSKILQLLFKFNLIYPLRCTGTSIRPFERSKNSGFVSWLCDKFTTFLLTNFPSSLLSFKLALLSLISCATSESSLLSSDSIPLTQMHALRTSSLSLFSKSRYKCLCATRFLIELKRTLLFWIEPGVMI